MQLYYELLIELIDIPSFLKVKVYGSFILSNCLKPPLSVVSTSAWLSKYIDFAQ